MSQSEQEGDVHANSATTGGIGGSTTTTTSGMRA
jgi:hypothetical protein